MKHTSTLLILLLLMGLAVAAHSQTTTNCLLFDGTNDYVDCGNAASLNITSGPITLEAWVYLDNTTQSHIVLSQMVPTGTGRLIIGYYQSGNAIFLGTTTSKLGVANARSYLVAGQWQHWAVVYNFTTDTGSFYLDGVSLPVTDVDNQWNPQGSTFRIGARPTGALNSWYLKGRMDEVRFWNVARTQQQIQDNMNSQLSSIPAELVGYWKLDEGGTNTVTQDATTNNNDGNLYPSPYASGPQWSTGPEVLPVELSSFTAVLTGENYVTVKWITQSETGVSGYYIYRSMDGDWANAVAISNMVNSLNSPIQQVYVYTDNELEEDGTYYYWLQVQDLDGSSFSHGPTSVYYSSTGGGVETPAVSAVSGIKSIYPNPITPYSVISYNVTKATDVRFKIYNSRGQLVNSINDGFKADGEYNTGWDGKDFSGNSCSTGIYYIKMQAGRDSSIRKAIIIK